MRVLKTKEFCCNCEGLEPLDAVMFKEFEKDSNNNLTGRARFSCDYLACPNCGERYIVDDSFDQAWYRASEDELEEERKNLY